MLEADGHETFESGLFPGLVVSDDEVCVRSAT